MPRKKMQAKADFKKPFKVLSRKAMIGWLAAVFIVCGWMFALGVLVGRDQAPIEFDLNALEKKITSLRQKESANHADGSLDKPGAPRDKKQLDFFEALPENREDTKLTKPPQPKNEPDKVKTSKKAESLKQIERKVASNDTSVAEERPKAAVVQKGAYTIQAASVRNKPDAERMVNKLKKQGHPAFLVTSQIKGKGTWHRVRIGSYPDRDAAKNALDDLRRGGMKPILVKTH